MKFGWINVVNILSLLLLLFPNFIAAIRHQMPELEADWRIFEIFEKVGRYGSMLFLILPLFAKGGEFGFASSVSMILWLVLIALCLIGYYICWIHYFINPADKAIFMPLAVIPSVFFLGNGILLRHWPLILCSILFAIGHIAITKETLE